MKKLKSLLILLCIGSIATSSCSSSTPIISETDITIEPATFTFTPEPTMIPKNTPTPTISKTKIDLSSELYIDENSSPDNLQGEQYQQEYDYFSNLHGNGTIYQFSDEEWITTL